MKNETTRRDFIRQIALASALLGIPPYLLSCNSCNDENEALNITIPTLPLMDPADAPFGVWRQMIEVLEKSPDHLIGRRKSLIAAKNPIAMTEFVRDNIQLAPGLNYFLRHAYRKMLYGPDVALRSGIGTLREKAEILKDMLVEAGFEARVVLENIDFSEEEIKDIVFRNYAREFNPPISKEQMQAWQKALGADSSNGSVKAISKSEMQADAFTKQIMTGFSDFDYKRLGNNFRGPDGRNISSVVYLENGEEKYAHIFDPSIPAGSLHLKNVENKFKDAKEIEVPKNEISLSLSYRNALEPHLEKELLSRTWDLPDLIGGTISLQFMNNMDFKSQATKTISDISSFTPCFSFQKIGVEQEIMEELSLMGEPINLSGTEVLKKENDETSEQDFDKMILPGNTANVQNLKINVTPMAFPQTRIEISPTDESGNVIEGLTAANFKLQDNQRQVVGILEQNVISPKIMMLHDTSGSMPREYRDKEHIAKFIGDVESLIREIYPHAKVKAQATGSDIYTSLLRAKQTDSDFIMYATDGDNNDKFDPKYLEIYNTGKPIVILEVREESYTYPLLKENIDNLISISAVDKEAVKQEIKNILSDLTFPPYVMTYQSFSEKEEHKLKVKLNDKDISDEMTFKFPEANDMFLGERMIGLYLTMKGHGLKVERTLAGWDHKIMKYEHSRSYINEVHEMLLGGAVMAFESEAPSLSIRLTEYLTTLLSNEKWFNAQREGDIEKAVEYLEEGTLSYPPMLLSMMQPLSDAYSKDTITFPTGFRCCMLKMKPGLYSTKSKVSFDYLPTANYLTLSRSGDGKINFKETMKKTMQFADLESKMFQDSTIEQLKNKKLISSGKAKKDERFKYKELQEKDPVFQYRILKAGDFAFFDQSMTAPAYFVINQNSGELYANLPDGTGGGGDSVERQLKELGRVVAEYQQLVSKMQLSMMISGVGGFALGVVATYSVTLVKLYAYASEAIILMDASSLDEQVRRGLIELACNVYKDIAYLSLGPIGKGMGGIENLIGSMGGNFSFVPCSGL